MSEPEIVIQNIVAFIDLRTQLDLEGLEAGMPLSYRRERFPALILKLKDPKISFLIFRNGKVNCTGANQIGLVKRGVDNMVRQLRSLGVRIDEDPSIKVTNLVATADLGRRLNLDELAMNLDDVEYEPETFPGLVYRPYGSRVSVLVFGNGKLVIAGFREESEGRRIVEGLLERLRDSGLIPLR